MPRPPNLQEQQPGQVPQGPPTEHQPEAQSPDLANQPGGTAQKALDQGKHQEAIEEQAAFDQSGLIEGQAHIDQGQDQK